MESEKKKGQGQGSMKKEKKEEEKKEGMGWRKKGHPLFFFFFPSSCFDAIPSLSPFVRFIPFEKYPVRAPRPTVYSSNTRFSYGRNSICLFPSPEMENRCSKHVAGPRNNAKTEDIIRYLLYFVPIFVHANFDFSHHLEFVNLEFIESKDLIRRKFVQINTNMSLIFV